MNNVDRYYKILDLEPGASLEDVKQSYKDMVFVWHPDRFPNHPRLQKKAHEKLVEINEARKCLQSQLQTPQKIASPPQPVSETSPARSQPRADNFYSQKTHQTWARSSNGTRADYVKFSYANQHDSDGWLD